MGTVRVGTSGWSYAEWVGPFYPEGTSAARMLPTYARRLAAVEAHSTHRRLPTPASLSRWVSQVPPSFRFAPKAHAGITHRRDLEGIDQRVANFLAALAPLGDLAGPVLHVLPHRQPDLHRLDRLLSAIAAAPAPKPPPVFELAPAWHTPEVAGRLAAAGAALAVVDRDDAPEALDLRPPSDPRAPVIYVRLRRTSYPDAALDAWARRAAEAAAGDGPDVYVFLKHDVRADGPRYALSLVTRLESG